jgi:hypothetical protein
VAFNILRTTKAWQDRKWGGLELGRPPKSGKTAGMN